MMKNIRDNILIKDLRNELNSTKKRREEDFFV
jgi:hypothetical protein